MEAQCQWGCKELDTDEHQQKLYLLFSSNSILILTVYIAHRVNCLFSECILIHKSLRNHLVNWNYSVLIRLNGIIAS